MSNRLGKTPLLRRLNPLRVNAVLAPNVFGRATDASCATADGCRGRHDASGGIVFVKTRQAPCELADAGFVDDRRPLERADPLGTAIGLPNALRLDFPPHLVQPSFKCTEGPSSAGGTQRCDVEMERLLELRAEAAAWLRSPGAPLARAGIQHQPRPIDAAVVKKAQPLVPYGAAPWATRVEVDVRSAYEPLAFVRQRQSGARSTKSSRPRGVDGPSHMRHKWSPAASLHEALEGQHPSQLAGADLAAQQVGNGPAVDRLALDPFAADLPTLQRNSAALSLASAGMTVEHKHQELARAWLRQAARVVSESPAASNRLAGARDAQAQSDAMAWAERIDRIAPHRPLLLDILAFALAAEGHLEGTLEERAEALALRGLRLNPARPCADGSGNAEIRRKPGARPSSGGTFGLRTAPEALSSKPCRLLRACSLH